MTWIDGKNSANGAVREIINPATLEVVDTVVETTFEDVDRMIEVANRVHKEGVLRKMSPSERGTMALKIADLLEQRFDDFAKAEATNTGKPFEMVAKADIEFAIDNIRFFAGAGRCISGPAVNEYLAGFTSLLRREPVGPVGTIVAWNFPVMLLIWKVMPALMAGCPVVAKPAPITPVTALMFEQLAADAGLPEGCLNIALGGNEIGQYIVEHPGLRMISFTGSSATGQQIMKSAASTLKRVQFELGGKAPVVIFGDCDDEQLASKITLGATWNTGQDCTAATRILVEKKNLNQIADSLVASFEKVKLGAQFDDDVEMGPLISQEHLTRVTTLVANSASYGAKILTGGADSPVGFERGFYFKPTVISDVEQGSEIVQNEVFGPVITLQPFSSEEEALNLANGVPYGLAASVFTSDIGRMLRFSKELEFGTVWVNDHIPLTSETPHGGFKQSGFGKDLAAESIGDYLTTKHIMIGH